MICLLVSSVKYGRLVIGSIANSELLAELFSANKFDVVMHFAAHSLVSESVKLPAKYYGNNVSNTLNLLNVTVEHDVKNCVFSSTAATFGTPVYLPIDESHPQAPINPYGASKLMVERILQDYATSYGLNSISLRYFNACGADPEGELGENHDPETHLIPLILRADSGRKDSITVFGRDYPTEDGTCIRDYIHVQDLCSAHLLAMASILNNVFIGAHCFNLGNGNGFSVLQILEAACSQVEEDGYHITIDEGQRRLGDPAILIADATLVKRVLNWPPIYTEVEDILLHAWRWEKSIMGMK
jgi:UDP-glucose 4-epimerase